VTLEHRLLHRADKAFRLERKFRQRKHREMVMRSKLLKIVTWLVVVTVLCVAIGVALLRVFVFTGGEKEHSSIAMDRVIARLHEQPNKSYLH
jgi:hypothetical protein